jgi:hypothetical protein
MPKYRKLQAPRSSDFGMGTHRYACIFFKDRLRHIQTSRFRDGEQQRRALEPIGLSAAETTILESMTRRSGSIAASCFSLDIP